MARKRMIDPSFWSDDTIIELTAEERLMFIGMWNFADDSGIIQNNEKLVKARVFPADNYTDARIRSWLDRFIEKQLFQVSDDGKLLRITNWTIYQKINRPQESKYQFTEQSVNDHGTITPNRIEQNRKEKNIIEAKSKAIPSHIDEVIEYFHKRDIVDYKDNAFKFFDYYASQGWKKANGRPVKDWKKCVTTWNFKNNHMDKDLNWKSGNPERKMVCTNPTCNKGGSTHFTSTETVDSLVKCPKCKEYGVLSKVEWDRERKVRLSEWEKRKKEKKEELA